MNDQNYQKAFSQLGPEMPKGLLEATLARLSHERRLSAQKRITFFAVVLLISTISLVPAALALFQNWANSSLSQLFSLVWSDLSIISLYWKNYLLSILESFPITSVAVFLAVLWIFLESLKGLAKELKQVLPHLSLFNN